MSQRIVTANVPGMKWLHLKLAHYHVEMAKILAALAKLYDIPDIPVLTLRQFIRTPNRRAERSEIHVVKGALCFMISVIPSVKRLTLPS